MSLICQGDVKIIELYLRGHTFFRMGPWLVLVSPGFRENVVATCKIGSFFV